MFFKCRIALWAVMCVIVSMSATHARTPTHAQVPLTIDVSGLNTHEQQELRCHSLNIYHEARGTHTANQVAVAWVVRNRMVRSNRSACAVIYAPGQFSWTRKRLPPPREADAWRRSQQLALMVMRDEIADLTHGATHFHENQIRPSWSNRARHSVRIGAHTFHRIEVAEAR
jgi:spore germination cell wall hydrolase CwlJ-like protein